MSRLGYRLKFYFFGFSLGCVVVWAIFYKDKDRRLSTPEGKVLGFLENTATIAITSEANCQLTCYSINEDFMNKRFWKVADVDFSESATQRKPCPVYVINSLVNDKKKVKIYIEACLNYCDDCDYEGTATLKKIEISNVTKACDC